mmetsp:Transcript_60369/g.112017  ORF Transcript_60369/g.112017 Transcript_60369/m.112017 type:complete len:322 (+) Transcript_60369:63-1028(+)
MKKKNKQGAAAGKEKATAKEKTDDEILEERRKQEAFEVAELFLKIVGTGFSLTSVLWFLTLGEVTPALPSLYPSSLNPALSLAAAGHFCIQLSKSTLPKGHWPEWRHAWHVALIPASGLLAAGFVIAIRRQALMTAFVRSAALRVCQCLAVMSGAIGLTAMLILPGRGSSSMVAKSQNTMVCACARMMLCFDCALFCALLLLPLSQMPWDEALGPATALTAMIPLLLIAVGLPFCKSDLELLAAVSTVLFFLACTTVRAVTLEGLLDAVPAVLLFLTHAALYLPYHSEELMRNPFNMVLRRAARDFVKMMANPVSGFGDDD